jgi:hypothetical protein
VIVFLHIAQALHRHYIGNATFAGLKAIGLNGPQISTLWNAGLWVSISQQQQDPYNAVNEYVI